MRKAKKSPVLKAYTAARRHRVPSWVGEGTVCLLKKVLEARARKWAQRASALQGISLKEREGERRKKERERERKKEREKRERKREREKRERGGEREREKDKEIKREKKKDTGTQALMEQRCFNQHGVDIHTVLQGSYSQQRLKIKIKIPDLQNIRQFLSKLQTITFYHMVHKKEEGTYHHNEK